MSVPQIGAQFGEIHNNGTGSNGNNGPVAITPYSNGSSSSVPGSGYPGGYYANHSNESSPTSPSMSGDSFNLQNSSIATTNCDCSQVTNAQEVAPTNAAATESPSNGDTSSSSSRK
ncbi:osteocalcin 2-like [Sitodiplosis mosellana]|uniref:osteocalcin 2-like n=1 Tax=Sitodiplosis mosellana TaxID=263140 RepID=UPI00244409A9|nr:osteocalcin 2-like [Sitodiplosis mosellana]